MWIALANISLSNLLEFQIIMGELYRNICLAFACIFVTTLLLLSNFLASVQVLLAVLFTLVNVGGSMYFWGEEGKRYLIV